MLGGFIMSVVWKLDFQVVKKGQIHSKCKACGNTSIIDPKHKLSTFIMKNPPKVDEKEKKENGNSGSTDNSIIDGEIPSDKELVSILLKNFQFL